MGFPVFMFLHDITDKAPLPFLSGSFPSVVVSIVFITLKILFINPLC